jgi:hypothetical protein
LKGDPLGDLEGYGGKGIKWIMVMYIIELAQEPVICWALILAMLALRVFCQRIN